MDWAAHRNTTTPFTLSDDADGTAWLEGGEFHLLGYSSASKVKLSFAGRNDLNVMVEVETRLVAGTDNNWHYLVCRAEDTDNYVASGISADGHVSVQFVVDNFISGGLPASSNDAVLTGSNAVNTMRLECIGSEIRFFVNDELIVELKDTTPVAGDIGLGVASLEGEFTEIAFDNVVFSVAAPSVATLPEIAP